MISTLSLLRSSQMFEGTNELANSENTISKPESKITDKVVLNSNSAKEQQFVDEIFDAAQKTNDPDAIVRAAKKNEGTIRAILNNPKEFLKKYKGYIKKRFESIKDPRKRMDVLTNLKAAMEERKVGKSVATSGLSIIILALFLPPARGALVTTGLCLLAAGVALALILRRYGKAGIALEAL